MSVFSSPVVKVEVSGGRGASFADVARRTGAFGAVAADNDLAVMDKLADYLLAENPGFQGNKGDPGGNILAVGAFSAIAGMAIPAGTTIVQTSDIGAPRYRYDAAVNAAFVTAHPTWATRDTAGRGFRLDMERVRPEFFGSTTGGTSNAAFAGFLDYVNWRGGNVTLDVIGTHRLTVPRIAITKSNVHIGGTGTLFFDTDETVAFGRLAFDGAGVTGGLRNVSCRDLTIYNRPAVYVSGFEPGYDGSGCLVTFRDCDGFLLDNVEAYNSPNYCISVLHCSHGTLSNNHLYNGTAGIQAQDGCVEIKYLTNHVHDTYDDGLAFGYWGRPNNHCIMMGNTVERTGARGLVCLGPTESIIMSGNVVRDTFLAGILIESNADDESQRLIGSATVIGNEVERAGMYTPTGFARGQDVAAGIMVNPSGGTIGFLKVVGNTVRNSRNHHLSLEREGVVNEALVNANIFDTISAVGDGGTATSGGGHSLPATDNYYPGVKVMNALRFTFTNNVVTEAHEHGIGIGASVAYARVSDNKITAANKGGFTSVTYAIRSLATRSFIHDNTVYRGANAAQIINATVPVVQRDNHYGDLAAYTVVDSFDRADVAPASGALGSVNGKPWTGSAAGIVANTAYLTGAAFAAVAVDVGFADVDASIRVTLASGNFARLIVRASSSNPGTGAAVILDTTGQLVLFTGSGSPTILGVFAARTNGTYDLRMSVKGNNVTAWINGVVVAAGSGPLPVSNFVGFQDNSAGTARFDDFRVVAAT
jgi:hypothetical protein